MCIMANIDDDQPPKDETSPADEQAIDLLLGALLSAGVRYETNSKLRLSKRQMLTPLRTNRP
jgi:hypothetical protein